LANEEAEEPSPANAVPVWRSLSENAVNHLTPADRESGPGHSLAIWLRLQKSLADNTGISLATLSRDNSVIGRIENDNSICQVLRVSPDLGPLCAADCNEAHRIALEQGMTHRYRCHAGLHCFAIPINVDTRQLVILGGRAFTSVGEYSEFLERYGEVNTVRTGEALRNVRFADQRELGEAAELLASTAEYHFRAQPRSSGAHAAAPAEASELLDAHLELERLGGELESRNRSIRQVYEFLRGVEGSLDSQRVYSLVLGKFGEIMRSERSSLMIFDAESNELALEAAFGYDKNHEGPVRMKMGEGISGSVLAAGSPMLVRDADNDPRVPPIRRGRYKTKSFISFPIMIGQRRIGVVNLADRTDGSVYNETDLEVVDLMASHLGLMIDRTEWHKKAEAYQQMSLTDPLTGLPNRRYLEERLYEEVERSKRHGTELSFMIIDVDRFKTFNDIYGHTTADRVLIKTAQILRRSVRAIDTSARFAGDEFCVVLPETDIRDAARIAERLRKAVTSAEFKSEQEEFVGTVTISIGVSSFGPARQSPLSIMESSDRALYQAKTRGRNCVAVYEGALPVASRPPHGLAG
jgi:diguanylate cyclase (GGDEF)-like protein